MTTAPFNLLFFFENACYSIKMNFNNDKTVLYSMKLLSRADERQDNN